MCATHRLVNFKPSHITSSIVQCMTYLLNGRLMHAKRVTMSIYMCPWLKQSPISRKCTLKPLKTCDLPLSLSPTAPFLSSTRGFVYNEGILDITILAKNRHPPHPPDYPSSRVMNPSH